MILDAHTLYLISKYDVGSSNIKQSFSDIHAINIANLYNSPPESWLISLSNKWLNSSDLINTSDLLNLSLFLITSPTLPLTALPIESTYYGLMTALSLLSNTFYK